MSEIDDLEAYVIDPPELHTMQEIGGRIALRKGKPTRSKIMSRNATRQHWLSRGNRPAPSLPRLKFLERD